MSCDPTFSMQLVRSLPTCAVRLANSAASMEFTVAPGFPMAKAIACMINLARNEPKRKTSCVFSHIMATLHGTLPSANTSLAMSAHSEGNACSATEMQ
eukprot:9468192-Pyramimonas_sp.AAC.3